jgi:hypothetical protein
MKTFWCKTHLGDLPISEQSPDSRYCQDCYEFLLKEARLLSSHQGRPNWIPNPSKYPVGKATKSKSTLQKPAGLSPQGTLNMHTVNEEKSEVCIIPSETPKRTKTKRGPKHIELPDDLILKWANEGMGSKAITTRLKGEHGIKVHYSTIQRRISCGKIRASLERVSIK